MINTLNPDEAKRVTNAIGEIENSMIRMDSERDLVKEICEEIKEKFEIPPTILKKVAKFNLDSAKKDKADEEMDVVDYLVELVKSSS